MRTGRTQRRKTGIRLFVALTLAAGLLLAGCAGNHGGGSGDTAAQASPADSADSPQPQSPETAGPSQTPWTGTDAPSRTAASAVPEGLLSVTFFDVGKADAILLQTSDSAVMIDTGTMQGAGALSASLAALGVEALDVLIITHFDKDHVGGAAEIIRTFPVERLLVSQEHKKSDEVNAYHAALRRTGLAAEEVSETFSFMLDGASYTVIPPEKSEYEKDTSNNTSLVTRTVYGSRAFLFTGDIEKERIRELLEADAALSADVLKMPHHGDHNSATKELIAVVGPAYAVITSSDEQPEEEKALKALDAAGAAALLTREGTVVITTDGETIEVRQDMYMPDAAALFRSKVAALLQRAS